MKKLERDSERNEKVNEIGSRRHRDVSKRKIERVRERVKERFPEELADITPKQ